ncbi:Corepressor interacting with RBPJ 1 [Frankliniella fusca]|uniref:Corepressor interacting with RBPJ 1 n=1 Tax=Frankliniella fusca TaxID=407009 RepID=A0AAE1LCT1_9NEOP|nr:Corepressor interacting with RBPJ 1 [Frankliniella fusca]
MGKGFNNYMCKKFFHPASRDNLKRVWMAEQQTAAYKQKQEELRVQYEKEQDLYTNKALMSKESKGKLSVNFLYEPPPGLKKDREREDDEPEFKFEWQRKYNAPRESYCKGDQEIRDQPFGIQVRNVRCIKCHKWGHINTDKECPMYNQSATGNETGSNLNPSDLIRQMREDGLAMKKGAVGLLELPNAPSYMSNQQLIPSSSEDEDHMNETELKFLEGLSTKKKFKLLRKLEKMEKKKKKKQKKGKTKDSVKKEKYSDTDSDSDSLKEKKKTKKVPKTQEDEQDMIGRHPKIKTEVENELYNVLGRKMDFEGPPPSHSKIRPPANGVNSRGRTRESKSRSNSRERSRSRSPRRRKHSMKDEYARDYNAKKSRRRSRSRDNSSPHKEKNAKSSRRERSLSRENARRRSRSPRDSKHHRTNYKH